MASKNVTRINIHPPPARQRKAALLRALSAAKRPRDAPLPLHRVRNEPLQLCIDSLTTASRRRLTRRGCWCTSLLDRLPRAELRFAPRWTPRRSSCTPRSPRRRRSAGRARVGPRAQANGVRARARAHACPCSAHSLSLTPPQPAPRPPPSLAGRAAPGSRRRGSASTSKQRRWARGRKGLERELRGSGARGDFETPSIPPPPYPPSCPVLFAPD